MNSLSARWKKIAMSLALLAIEAFVVRWLYNTLVPLHAPQYRVQSLDYAQALATILIVRYLIQRFSVLFHGSES